jgi:hypothetical protein
MAAEPQPQEQPASSSTAMDRVLHDANLLGASLAFLPPPLTLTVSKAFYAAVTARHAAWRALALQRWPAIAPLLDALIAKGQGQGQRQRQSSSSSVHAFCCHRARVEAAARIAASRSAPQSPPAPEEELARLREFFRDAWLEVQITHVPQPASFWLAQVRASEALGDEAGAAIRRKQMANVVARGPLASKLIHLGSEAGEAALLELCQQGPGLDLDVHCREIVHLGEWLMTLTLLRVPGGGDGDEGAAPHADAGAEAITLVSQLGFRSVASEEIMDGDGGIAAFTGVLDSEDGCFLRAPPLLVGTPLAYRLSFVLAELQVCHDDDDEGEEGEESQSRGGRTCASRRRSWCWRSRGRAGRRARA